VSDVSKDRRRLLVKVEMLDKKQLSRVVDLVACWRGWAVGVDKGGVR
jgi:hypothetical protein